MSTERTRVIIGPNAKNGFRFELVTSRFAPLPTRPPPRVLSPMEEAEKERQRQALALGQELNLMFQTVLERVPNLLHLCLTTTNPTAQMRADCAALSLLFGLMAAKRSNAGIVPFGGHGLKRVFAPYRLKNEGQQADLYRSAIGDTMPSLSTDGARQMLELIQNYWISKHRRTAGLKPAFKAKIRELKDQAKKGWRTVPTLEIFDFLYSVTAPIPAS